MPPTLSDSPGFPRPPGPPQTLSRFSSDITKRITVVTFTGPAALHTSPAPPHPTDFIKIHFRHLNFPDALFLPIRGKKKKIPNNPAGIPLSFTLYNCLSLSQDCEFLEEEAFIFYISSAWHGT